MAYFSNSSEGEVLEAMCERCTHLGPEDGPGCPVLHLHLLWNYDQCGKDEASKAKKFALSTLIPQPDGKTDCKMFNPKRNKRARIR